MQAVNRFPNGTLLMSLLEWLVPPSLYFIQNNVKQLTPVTDIELVGSILNFLDCFFAGPFVRCDVELKDADLPKVRQYASCITVVLLCFRLIVRRVRCAGFGSHGCVRCDLEHRDSC